MKKISIRKNNGHKPLKNVILLDLREKKEPCFPLNTLKH